MEDFRTYDHIVALDRNNLAVLHRLKPADARAELSMLLDHVEGRHGQSVADPYFGPDEGFDLSWRDVALGVEGLVVTCASRQRVTPDDRIASAIGPEFAFVQQEVIEPRFDRGGPEMLHR